MSAHTPGPWIACGRGGEDSHDGSRYVRHIAVSVPADVLGSASADVALIAAAPEMLAALKACMAVLESWADYSAPEANALESARSAIARAEGR